MAKQIDILCSESSLYNAWNIVKAKGAAGGIDGISKSLKKRNGKRFLYWQRNWRMGHGSHILIWKLRYQNRKIRQKRGNWVWLPFVWRKNQWKLLWFSISSIRSLTYWYNYRDKTICEKWLSLHRWNRGIWSWFFARVQLATNSQIICELLKLIIAADYQPLAILEPSKTQHLPSKNRGICEKTRQDRINCWEYGI